MRKILFVLLTSCLWACTGTDMKMQEAKKTAETAINLIGNKKFDELATYYSEDFSVSETKEDRNRKFALLVETIGSLQSFEITDSITENTIGEESRITLKYKVIHSNITTLETYKIGKERGKYVIAGIDIQMNN